MNSRTWAYSGRTHRWAVRALPLMLVVGAFACSETAPTPGRSDGLVKSRDDGAPDKQGDSSAGPRDGAWDVGGPADGPSRDRLSPDGPTIAPDRGTPASCLAPWTPCGSLCVDIANDAKHCGGCFRRCGGATDRCDEGQCVCGPNLQTCGPGQNCVEGACRCIAGGLCDGCCAGDRCLALGVTQSLVACGKAGETCASCDDGLTCTVDSCLGSGDCVNRIDTGFCAIDARCYPAGPNPDNGCQVCDPNRGTTRWAEGACISTVAGSGAKGLADGPALDALFSGFVALAHDPQGRVVIADSGNYRIRRLARGTVTTMAGSGASEGFADGAVAQAQFGVIESVAVGTDGQVYLADLTNNRIRVIDAGFTMVRTLAGEGTYGYLDGPAANAQFAQPRGIAVDAQDRVYVADTNSNTIRMVSGGRVTTVAGQLSLCPSLCAGGCHGGFFCSCTNCGGFADGGAAVARFAFPRGLATDATGQKIFVVDTGNRRIRLIEGGQVRTVAGSAIVGNLDGAAALARFTWPTSVVFDSQGVLYVGDTDTFSIRRIADGIVSTVAGTSEGYRDGGVNTAMLRPLDLSIAPSGAIVFGDTAAVRQLTLVP